METAIKKEKFNRRSFSALIIFFAGLFLPVSGYLNHKLQFEPLTSQRHFWMSIHNFAAILFVVFAIVHVFYNWKALKRYIKKVKDIFLSKEAMAAIALIAFVVGIMALHVFHVR